MKSNAKSRPGAFPQFPTTYSSSSFAYGNITQEYEDAIDSISTGVEGDSFVATDETANFFKCWFDIAVSGIDMLEVFLKHQKPKWNQLDEVMNHLTEEKRNLKAWKDTFERDVLRKALSEEVIEEEGNNSSSTKRRRTETPNNRGE